MKYKVYNWIIFIRHNWVYVCLLVVLFITYIALLPKAGGIVIDLECYKDWAIFIFRHGVGDVYKTSDMNYMPLYYYMLFLFGKFLGSIEAIEQNFYYLKVIPLVFDFIAGFYLFKYLHLKFNNINQSFILALFFFLNIAYFYNTLIIGQTDGINACFVFFAFFFALKQRVLATLIFMLLAINFKLLSGLFLPLIGLMLLPAIINQFSLKRLFVWIIIPISLQFLLIFPFLLAGDLDKLIGVIKKSDNTFPFISLSASNFWYWIVPGSFEHSWGGGIDLLDSVRIWEGIRGLTYKRLGLALFFTSSFVALFPLLKNIWYRLFYRQSESMCQEKFLIMAALIPLLFFFLCTQMHERYSHMAFIFLAAYSLSTGKYLPYIVCSIAYFLNMERVMSYWLINHNAFIFNYRFLSLLYFISIAYLFVLLYDIKLFRKKVVPTTVPKVGF